MVSGWQTSFAATLHATERPKIEIQLFAEHNDYQAELVKRQLIAIEGFFEQIHLEYRWPQQLQLNIYGSATTFQELQLQRWNRAISFSGFYDVNQQFVAVLLEGDTKQMLQRVRHELVHVLLAENYPNAPAWLHEGLAEAFENPSIPVQLSTDSFQHWLWEMHQFAPEQEASYRSAVQGTRFLIQQLRHTPNLLELLALEQPLSPGHIDVIEQQWRSNQ